MIADDKNPIQEEKYANEQKTVAHQFTELSD